ncbi:hypothetical protein CBR_g32525 [Chara braunii]|uniref:DUF659 domain-containing protein n=1 Tax=Chara braunii TaxID=69332 RepID=A0A388LGV1_CHABU|nr:hypothetical protein CBR_g32525 [Chara braunii]|eukprot:GBG81536.1 hypothetical protein CBR_g32525 [Chara braunii]
MKVLTARAPARGRGTGYCETRFVGNKSVLEKHFMKKCSIDLVTRALTAEERVMRVEGIRLGKHQASQLLGATGGSSGLSTGPSSSSFVPPSSPRERPSDGETPSPAGSGTCFPLPPGSGGRSVRQTLIEEADSIITHNERTSRKMDQFLICMNQPFSLVENYYFVDFRDAVKKFHPNWWPRKRDEMRTKRLDGQFSAGSIVDVVMDNARVCAKAGKMVEAKYPGIFSVGCTAHALDLALEDMYKCMDWMKAVVDKGNQVGKFFTKVDKVRAMYNKIANAQLKRPAVARFATNFKMLQSLKTGRNPSALCVGNAAWVEKLASSSAACERNLSLHQLIYGQRRTKLVPERLSKLVYNNWNIQLATRTERGDEENPRRSRKKQSSSSSSSASEDSAPENSEEEEEMSQHGSGEPDGSGVSDGDEPEEDPSQAGSHGEEQPRGEDE